MTWKIERPKLKKKRKVKEKLVTVGEIIIKDCLIKKPITIDVSTLPATRYHITVMNNVSYTKKQPMLKIKSKRKRRK